MATKIILKKSNVVGKKPTASQIDYGELTVNVADKKLYTKDSNGDIIELGGGSISILNGGSWDRAVAYDGEDADPTTVTDTYDGGGA
jgi:hypothetical protein